ncbi:MAG: polysaccharide deacetylase family protein [Clostridia bacterium]|nr:polysaccharide deacetylase family protein [Clostridia bacterium]
MKRFLSILLCATLVITACSCKNKKSVSADLSDITTSKASSSNMVTSPEIVEIEAFSSKPETSSEYSSKPLTTTSKANYSSSKVQTSSQNSQNELQQNQIINSVQPLNYTVNDPNNLRGLSTEKKGYSFGIAKDGKPHSQSVINQNTFDGFENVKALALDTKTAEKVMYLTFDNGYEYENLTADILDTLKEKGVKAAFFITMSYAKSNKALVQRMIDEGHIVGNHSTTHPSFPSLSRTQMAEEIATLDNYLRETFGYTSPYFRFPAGEYSECSLELVTSIGFRSVFWSVAYADWDTSNQKGTDFAYNTVTSRFHPGAVILLHAVSKDNAAALGSMIDFAVSQGYTFKTLDNYFG